MTDHTTAANGLLDLAAEADKHAQELRLQAHHHQTWADNSTRDAEREEAKADAYRAAARELNPPPLTLAAIDTQTAVASMTRTGRKQGTR